MYATQLRLTEPIALESQLWSAATHQWLESLSGLKNQRGLPGFLALTMIISICMRMATYPPLSGCPHRCVELTNQFWTTNMPLPMLCYASVPVVTQADQSNLLSGGQSTRIPQMFMTDNSPNVQWLSVKTCMEHEALTSRWVLGIHQINH